MAQLRARRRQSAHVIEELGRELTAVGIRGRRRERILAEFADHLACNPDAELGDPHSLAAQFADELATDGARRTALWTFGALVITAFAVVGTQASLPTIPDIAGGRSALLGVPAALAVIVGTQVAFAAGCLAALRGLRLGGAHEVALVRRRIAVALSAGALTASGSALYAVNFWADVPRWWAVLAVAGAGAATLSLGAAALAYARDAALEVSPREPARGLSADLGRLARPWGIGAAAVVAMLAGTSVLEGSAIEGLIRAAFEGALFAVCFVAFRRPLALTD
jgi:hypothetical protein